MDYSYYHCGLETSSNVRAFEPLGSSVVSAPRIVVRVHNWPEFNRTMEDPPQNSPNVSLGAVVLGFAAHRGGWLIHFRDNLIPRVAFWPLVTLFLFTVTFVTFY